MPIDPPKEKHDHHTLKFPENFLWGTATSAHQVEGNNFNSDWWYWEQRRQPEEKRSGIACDQYNLYPEDFQMSKDLGHNAHRLSIEWARIEPEEGKFDQSEIEHYQKVLKDLKDKGFTVMLTLNHITIPLWLAKKGGWENFNSPNYFNRFVKRIVPELKDLVDLWITINEPGVYAFMAYQGGTPSGSWPPQKNSNFSAMKVFWNMARAHKKAYNSIHKVIPNAQVGIAQNAWSFEIFHRHSILESLFQTGWDVAVNHMFYKLTGLKTHDFLGVNYYFNYYISFNGESRLPSLVDISKIHFDVSDMGWEIYPEGIFDVLMDFSDYHKPIYITENGLASTNDDRRCRFLIGYLKEIYHAISYGIDVKGYFHWSLIDNFELADGFGPRFGLVEVDYATQKRTPRPSAHVYQRIIEENGIPHYLMKFLGHRVNAKEVLKEKDNV